jgi:N-acetylglucosamine-6-sulfatase
MKPSCTIVLLLALSIFSVSCGLWGEHTEQQKPNILFILTDDQALSTIQKMPTVQAELASKGLSFENAFVTTPECCPSRATILTGRYAHNHGIFSSSESKGGGEQAFTEAGLDQDTIATRLRSAGYTTGLFGKYMNDYTERYVPPGWDRWFAYTLYGGPGSTFEVNSDGKLQTFKEDEVNQTDLVRERAKQFVTAHVDQPWIAYVAPKEPHAPHDPPPRHTHDYDRVALPEPPSFDTVDPSQPGSVRDMPSLSDDVQSWLKEVQPKHYEQELQQYERKLRREGENSSSPTNDARSYLRTEYEGQLEDLQTVDDLVGELVAALEETGQLKRTYIFYMTDNGYLLGEHRLVAKGSPYEESIGTPLLVRGPGVPAEQSRGQLVANLDIAQTFADLAGASSPTNTDGRSLAPLLTENPPQEWRNALLLEESSWSGVRTERYAYYEYETGARELYDLQEDPYQLKSIHQSADPALLSDLRARLEDLEDCTGKRCRTAEDRGP